MTSTLQLTFAGKGEIQLFESAFQLTPGHPLYRSVRGKTAGAFAFQQCGTFQWSSAVMAMSLLFVRAKLRSLDPGVSPWSPLLQGGRGSPASSLDMSIMARTSWLADMFGVSTAGELVARRIFIRSNSSLKMPGPVSISLNPRIVSDNAIDIIFDGVIADTAALKRAEQYLTLAATEGRTMRERRSVKHELAA